MSPPRAPVVKYWVGLGTLEIRIQNEYPIRCSLRSLYGVIVKVVITSVMDK